MNLKTRFNFAWNGKKLVLAFLVFLCAGLIIYCRSIRGIDIVYTHLFYIPICMAVFWFGRQGVWIAFLLGAALMCQDFLLGIDRTLIPDFLRALIFIAVSTTIAVLREQSRRSEKETRKMRDYFETLLYSAKGPIIVSGSDGAITMFNAAAEQTTGYRSDEAKGRRLDFVFPETSKQAFTGCQTRGKDGRTCESIEIPIVRKDGERRVLLWNFAGILDPDHEGETIATISQGQDITLRKQAEENLLEYTKGLESRERITESMLERHIRMMGAYEKITDVMLRTLDLEDRLDIAVKEIAAITGADRSILYLVKNGRLVPRKWIGFSSEFIEWAGGITPDDIHTCDAIHTGRHASADTGSRLETALRKEGAGAWATIPLRSQNDLSGLFVLAFDRIDPVEMEQDKLLSPLIGNVALMLEHAGLYRTAQERLARLTTLREIDRAISANLSMEGIIEVVLKRMSPHIPVDAVGISLIDWEKKKTRIARLYLPGELHIAAEAFSLSDSLLFQLGVEKQSVMISDVKSDPRLQNHCDIIKKYNLVTYVGMPLIVQDQAIGVLHLFTVEPRLFSQEDLDFFATMAGQSAISVQNAYLYQTTQTLLEETRQAYETLKKTKSQLIQAQKMESIGTLAGGIAHDFNNVLTVILGNTELALEDVSNNDPVKENLLNIQQASLRARDLIKQILTFSRQRNGNPAPARIGQVIEESVKLLRSSMPASIEIRKNIAVQSDLVMADPVQIEQVVMNICTNALQAMDRTEGVLELALTDAKVGEDSRNVEYAGVIPGDYVRLSIRDTGPGIPPEIMERIFDPYFTTKEIGEGTGLGLSVVHGIVKQHRGSIYVESEPGKGACFHILLPKAGHGAESDLSAPDASERPPRGTETILFVDDEDHLAAVGRQMLERLGYRVESKTDPIDALEAFKRRPEQYDLVITDMTMPYMTGETLTESIKKIRHQIPVILCTGFSHKIDEARAAQIGISAFIMKPYSRNQIAGVVRKVLDTRGLEPELSRKVHEKQGINSG